MTVEMTAALATTVAGGDRGEKIGKLTGPRGVRSTPAAVALSARTDSLIARLEATADVLAATPPELDGLGWMQLDAALRAVHAALVALRTLDRLPPAPQVASAPAGSAFCPAPLAARL
jgi:hypothetical protein